MVREALTFDDVLIVPGYSEVESRFDPSTESSFVDLPVPAISANMDSVTESEMAVAIEKAGGLGVLHRFLPKEEKIRMTQLVAQYNKHVAVSLGIGDPEKVADWAQALADAGANILVVDVAHGFQKRVLDCVEEIRRRLDDIIIVAGNIATGNAAYALWGVGVDAVKVGIGPGAACTTRTTTGVGYPQLSAILDVCAHKRSLKVIADGGITNTGDFCKAIAAGADAVMMGSLFAGCDESPGEIIYPYGDVWRNTFPGTAPTVMGPTGATGVVMPLAGNYSYPIQYSSSTNEVNKALAYKVFRGMASSEAREAFGISESTGYNEHIPEGVSGTVPAIGPVADLVDSFKKALQSSMSYVGASNIREFHEKVEFVKVTENSIMESEARI